VRLLVHIGGGKTASTLLQHWLNSNRNALGNWGIYLPESPAKPNNKLLHGYFSRSVPAYLAKDYGVSSKEHKAQFFEGFLSRFSDEVEGARKSHHTVVVTSEQLGHLKQEEIRDLHNYLGPLFDAIDVVCYFREPISHAVSRHNQQLRGQGMQNGVEAFVREQLKSSNYDYTSKVDKWASIFGLENFHPRLFESRFLTGGDIRRDFLSIVSPDIPVSSLDWSIETANESVSALQVAALYGVNNVIPYWLPGRSGVNEKRLALGKTIRQSSALRVGKVSFTPTSEDLQRSRALTAEFLERNFPSGERFSEYVPAPADQIVSLQVAEAAVEEAITIGLKAGSALSPKQVNLLRDVALKIREGKPLTVDDALEMMRIALYFRPEDELLQQKVHEWEHKEGSVIEDRPSVVGSWLARIRHRISTPHES
jgi:hypothetical protein